MFAPVYPVSPVMRAGKGGMERELNERGRGASVSPLGWLELMKSMRKGQGESSCSVGLMLSRAQGLEFFFSLLKIFFKTETSKPESWLTCALIDQPAGPGKGAES